MIPSAEHYMHLQYIRDEVIRISTFPVTEEIAIEEIITFLNKELDLYEDTMIECLATCGEA